MKTSDEVLTTAEREIAQVMNIDDYADVQQLARKVGNDMLREVISDVFHAISYP